MEGQFGKYTLLDHVGRGGVGSVYRASDNQDGSIVAVKLFESTEERPPEATRKLRDREVRMLISVQHPNIVKFREAGQTDEDYYYAMEFVEVSLLKRMRGGAGFSLSGKVTVLRQTASALVAIHRQGIVHRDVKPGNILLDQDPSGAIHVRLTDFGIAKNVSETDVLRAEPSTKVPGTLKYLSPEQIERLPVDGRSDVFSLGLVAYELLTGQAPFEADDTSEWLAANAERIQTPARELSDDVPPFLSEIVDKMLVKDREKRYDAETLVRDLELVQQHLASGAAMLEQTDPASLFYVPPEQPKVVERRRTLAIAPVSWAAAVLIVLSGVLAGIVLWPSPAPEGTPPPPAARSASAELREAASAERAGRHWQALTLVGAVAVHELSATERQLLADLTERVRSATADQLGQAADRMLDEGRTEEAAIVLWQMEDLAPGTQRTLALASALRELRRLGSPEEQWQKALEETHALVGENRYGEALSARRELLAQAKGDPERESAARDAIGDLLDQWARFLLKRRPEAQVLERFLTTVQENSEFAPGRPSADAMGGLHLELAALHARGGDYQRALGQYALAAASGHGPTARRAEEEAARLRQRLTDVPHEAAEFADELARQGFEGDLWRRQTGPGAAQSLAEGVLKLSAAAGQEPLTVSRETARPIRNLGFAAGVQMRASAGLSDEAGRARAGLAVLGADGSAFELAFDGRGYSISTARESGQMAAARELAGARGDEPAAWHLLSVSYDFNTGELAARLDGEELHRYHTDLGDFRLRVFLYAEAGASAEAEFKDVFCRPQ